MIIDKRTVYARIRYTYTRASFWHGRAAMLTKKIIIFDW